MTIMPDTTLDLTGKLLVAMPSMGDPRFAQSVIYLTSHGSDGAMGLAVNRRAQGISLSDVLDQLSGGQTDAARALAVHVGGPVETGRGFVLHSDDYHSAMQTLVLPDGFAMTVTRDILEDIAQGRGPSQAMLMLGYAGWGPGQLERGIAQNGWLIVDADRALVFDAPDRQKWQLALGTLGIDPLLLSGTAGRA